MIWKLSPKEWMRELVTRGLGQMRFGGGRAVLEHHVEEGADRGVQGHWAAGWTMPGFLRPHKDFTIGRRMQPLVCVCVSVSLCECDE